MAPDRSSRSLPQCFILFTTSLLALTVLLPTTSALACSCAVANDAAAGLEGADVVFEGKVIHSNRSDAMAARPPVLPEHATNGAGIEQPNVLRRGMISQTVDYRFAVERSWKGATEPILQLRTPASSAACGRRFESGSTYLVYANRDGDGVLFDTLCSRSRESVAAVPDIKFLNSATATKPPAPAPTGDRESPEGTNAEPVVQPPDQAPGARETAR